MSQVTVAEVRALTDASLSDGDLQGVIDREEAYLARRIGPLVGPRTVTISQPATEFFRLMRPASTATATDAGAATAVELVDERYVYRANGYWNGAVTITYTPNDTAEVERVIIELVRLALSETAYMSETIGDYSYQRPEGRGRTALVASLMTKPFLMSIRMDTA